MLKNTTRSCLQYHVFPQFKRTNVRIKKSETALRHVRHDLVGQQQEAINNYRDRHMKK